MTATTQPETGLPSRYGDYDGPMTGVAVIIRDPATDLCLWGLRHGSHGAGTWALFGGKQARKDRGPHGTVIRECYEEVGVEVTNIRRLPYTTYDEFLDHDREFTTLYMVADLAPGSWPTNREPDKCLALQWAPWNSPPRPLFGDIDGVIRAVPDLSVLR